MRERTPMIAVQHTAACPGASGSADPLAPAGQAFRLASGIFYDHAALYGAVTDLLRRGFTRRDMCLAGTRDALGALIMTPACDSNGAVAAMKTSSRRYTGPSSRGSGPAP